MGMKQKVSDYIADFLVKNNIKDVFELVGGGAMHLVDSFGHKEGLKVTYFHHEQAAAIAAEAYARVNNDIAAVCVSPGPGATNAITGCLCGYMGSIPMLFFSGQVRYPHSVKAMGLALRTNGEKECDICSFVSGMTKYCEMVTEPKRIRYVLEKALFLAKSGRPGPVWLDMPLDTQSAVVETDELLRFDPAGEGYEAKPAFDKAVIKTVVDRIASAQRPVLYCGMGVRLSGAYDKFRKLVDLLKIPVTTGMASLDFLPDDHKYYAGRPGSTGDRAGNFAVQNSDVFLSIGSRLSYKQTGFNTETWARAAYKIMVDIDPEELKKGYLNLDLPILADANDFITAMVDYLTEHPIEEHSEWMKQCKEWLAKYPVVTPDKFTTDDGRGSIYVFYQKLTEMLPENTTFVTSTGHVRIIGRTASIMKEGQRVIKNDTTGTLGYCLPGAIGVCIANHREDVILTTGEGSIQFNLQELQTIKQNRLPIHIIVVNNCGYHSMRYTEKTYFKNHTYVGLGEDSGDLSFPDLSKIADAYGYPYFESKNNDDLEETLKEFLACKSYCIMQVYVTPAQFTEPKSSSKLLADGNMVSAPLEDLYPFLSHEELAGNMYIPMLE